MRTKEKRWNCVERWSGGGGRGGKGGGWQSTTCDAQIFLENRGRYFKCNSLWFFSFDFSLPVHFSEGEWKREKEFLRDEEKERKKTRERERERKSEGRRKLMKIVIYGIIFGSNLTLREYSLLVFHLSSSSSFHPSSSSFSILHLHLFLWGKERKKEWRKYSFTIFLIVSKRWKVWHLHY